MKLTLNKKLSRHKAKVFVLCSFNIKNMTFLFFGLLLGEQLISAGIESIFWGETFRHGGDSVAFILTANVYFYYSNELGEFLLDLTLNAEVEDD